MRGNFGGSKNVNTEFIIRLFVIDRKNPEVVPATASPNVTQTFTETAVSLPSPVPVDDASRKSKSCS